MVTLLENKQSDSCKVLTSLLLFPQCSLQSVSIVRLLPDLGCLSHGECDSDEYCDTEGDCFACGACATAYDAFDGICPTKCGGTVNLQVGSSIPNTTEAATVGIFRDAIQPSSQLYSLFVTSAVPEVAYDAPTAVTFPSIMSERLNAKLVNLALIVQSNVQFTQYGASIRVLSSYEVADSLTVSYDSLSYHYEGRAMTMRLSCPPEHQASCDNPDLLSELARFAHAAGFDWVWFKDNATVYASVSADTCTSPVDLAFLLDGSGSIEDPSYGGGIGYFADKELEFARNVTSFFAVGSGANESRIGAIVFSTGATVEFDLATHLSTAAVRAAIAEINYPTGATYMSTGLRLTRTALFENGTTAGVRPDSYGIPRVVIVVTDGQSTSGYEPASQAANLHDLGVTIFAIGAFSLSIMLLR